MKQYLDLLKHIKETGITKADRTGTGTTSVFGYQMRFDLQEGFPLLTTKKVFTRGIIHELLWFLQGNTNIKYLVDNGVHIWDEWADENGELGPVYGSQWRSWHGQSTVEYNERNGTVYQELNTPIIDQIEEVIHQIKTNPDSRRLMVTAWNPAEVHLQKLPPCHVLFQFYTSELSWSERAAITTSTAWRETPEAKLALHGEVGALQSIFDRMNIPRRKLSCQLYQRSADTFLGVPFNIASYALLTHMIAQQCNMVVGDFVWTGGDVHLYSNHSEQVNLQLTREPKALPKLRLPQIAPKSISDYVYEDFVIEDYDPHPAIKAEVSV